MIYAFWTGEKGYRRMKLRVFRLKAKAILIDSGDGNEFPLTWKAVCRHSAFRWKHPLPTDHGDFIETKANPDGDKVLIVQSAEPSHVLKALRRLEEKSLFVNPRFTLFCRQKPEVIRSFQGHPLLHRILAHSETRGSLGHLRNLRQERFDAVVIFFTGDPGFLKIKVFAFLLGIRHKLIFNESNDCFFLTFNRWLGFMARRMKAQASSGTRVSAGSSQRVVLSLILKTVILPFRFVWLLLVWLHLRFESWRYSR